MARLWPGFHSEQPWGVWFWAEGEPIALSPGQYEFYKIPPEDGYQEQLAFRSPVDRTATQYGDLTVRAGIVYLLTYPGDLPNWGTIASLVAISPPCGNWNSLLYETTEYIRSQTWGLLAAIQAEREKVCSIIAAVAMTGQLSLGVLATIQAQPELPLGLKAAVLGERSRDLPIRAAIRAERILEPSIMAAVGKDFELPAGITATVQGDVEVHCHLKAAVLGETEKSVGIVAYVVKSREQAILLEMENLGPQDLDFRSVPNWPSKVKDYRKSSLSPRDS